MGVPSFYKWLSQKYPKIKVDVLEEKGEGENVDASLKNPNDLEFDHLYLDMNGIIHPCFHPEDSDIGPTTFDEVFENVYAYIDRIFNIIRPRKLLYMAIDGVAPRAKMNQQRTRRFRNAKDRDLSDKEEERLRKEFELQGKTVLPKEEESDVSDSNIITPGTEFMQLLSMKLQSYIKNRMYVNSAWKKIKVILSNANVPGEGEHKIMSFIRSQRSSPGYDPNTRHCLYGLDADLIMLALASHEIHFSILREQVFLNSNYQNPPAFKSSLQEAGGSNQIGSQDSISSKKVIEKKPYEFLHVWILREYLELDLKITDPPKDFHEDLERLIDDFIFMCFFAGNDFLPHMPTLEIHEGAINLMMHVYKKEFKNMGGYLVDMSRVDDRKGGFWKQSRVEKFILAVGSFEDQIFRKRAELRDRQIRKIELDDAKARDEAHAQLNETFCNFKASNTGNVWRDDQASVSTPDLFIANNSDVLENTKHMKEKLKENLRKAADTFKHGMQTDKVRLGQDGWKKRFYVENFSVDGSDEIECSRKKLVQKYTEGLCWVLLYYFSGVPSWKWFYPYHYGPFASDLKGLSQVKIKFEKGAPFRPFDQLMGVLPPSSAHALPGPLKKLMLDEISPIINFYPNDFEIDAEGRRFVWTAICKLPFIEEERLLVETRKVQSDLKDHEMMRNAETDEMLFVESSTPLGGFLLPLYTNGSSAKLTDLVEIDSCLSRELNGAVHVNSGELSVQGSDDIEDYKSSNVLCALYKAPSRGLLNPRPLEGVEFPTKIVDEAEILEATLWHETSRTNRSSTYRPQFNAKGLHPGVAGSCSRTGWGQGTGRCHSFTTQSQTDVRHNWHGRQNNFVNPRTQVQRPVYRPQSNSLGSAPTVDYRGAGIGWSRGRGQPCSSRSDAWRQEFPVHTSYRPGDNVAVSWRPRVGSSGSSWRSSNIGSRPPHVTPSYSPKSNKETHAKDDKLELHIGLQRMSALRIPTSDQDDEELLRPHAGGALHSEAHLKQRSWWPSNRSDGH